MPLLEIDIDLTFSDFSLRISESISETPLSVFGPSGAGKSTLLRLLAGLSSPDKGRIVLNGQILFDSQADINLPPEQRAVGLVPQEGLLFPHMNVQENLMFGMNRIKGRQQKIRFDDVVDVLDIDSLLKRNSMQLSGGEKQRVSLGRALLSSPLLLLFDEPLSSVDVRLKRRILPYLIRAIEFFEMPAIYVSHSQDEVIQIARNLLVINDGRALACGQYSDIISNQQVYEVFSREGVENCIRGKVLKHRTEEGYTEIKSHNAIFRIPPNSLPIDSDIQLGIRANDIILASSKPEKISTRNVMPALVKRLSPVGDILIALLDVGCELLVELTPSAVKDLGISVGKDIWVLIKTNAFTVLRT